MPSLHREISPNQIGIGPLSQYIDNELQAVLYRHFSESGGALVSLSGRLGVIVDKAGYTYFDVPLQDPSGNEVLLDIPKSCVDTANVQMGNYVKVVGSLYPKRNQFTEWKVKIVVRVASLQLVDSPSEVVRKQKDRTDIEALKAISFSKADFPHQTQIALTLIVAQTSQVLDDFQREIQKLNEQFPGAVQTKETFRVNVLSAHEISNSIDRATGNVLVVLRGGGEAQSFDCFDNLAVLNALAKFKGYRIIGLGHTQHNTLADFVCDHSATTPHGAGSHIAELVNSYWFAVESKLRDTHRAYDLEVKKLQSALTSRKNDITRLTTENQNVSSEHQQALSSERKQNMAHSLKTAVFTFVVGMVVMWWLMR
jgi:Exonuclease VII, large subunit